jgi:hypothetical protein
VKELKLAENLPTERVLGMFWDPEEDQFIWKCNFNKVPKDVVCGEKIPTKREILGLVMYTMSSNSNVFVLLVYDPLGFLGYLTIKAKNTLQEIWRSGIGWDDEIAGSTYEKLTASLNELKSISSMKIPRCYSLHLKMGGHNQLHVFCDTSEQQLTSPL